ncbi:MAG: ExeM/NucH family extracellular endonuclease, partial [Cytophagales bacterium]|nr:ExeM/NucH family extracellular endonuclease [Cytophagales bacterium]
MKRSLLFWIGMLLMPVLPASAQVVISQVYGGGGNAGAPYTHDFIELFNAGTAPVSLNGLSLQYTSASGTGNFGASASQLTELRNVTLQPGQYFLVQQAGGTTGAVLPAPDFTDATPINMSGTAGKVALVTGTASLGCNGGSAPCSNESVSRILDLVGFGSANYFEGAAAAPAPSNTTAIVRKGDGCTDTGNNSDDFVALAPAPRNTGTPLKPCNTTNEPTNPSVTAGASPATVAPGAKVLLTATVAPGANPASTGLAVVGDLTAIGGAATQQFFNDGTNGDAAAGDNIFSYDATVAEGTANGAKSVPVTVTDAQNRSGNASASVAVQANDVITAIYTIQGSGTASPVVGQTVTTRGVVVGDFQGSTSLNGFFIQDAAGDGNPATSDGIFVFAPNSPDVSVGQTVQITATVQEFSGQTQLSTVTDLSVLGPGTVTPVAVSLPVSSTGALEPYEGMLVSFPQVLTVSQNFTLARFGEVWLSANPNYSFNAPDGRLFNPTNFVDPTDNPAAGVTNRDDNKAAVTAQQSLNNRSEILLDDASTVQNPATVPYLGPDNTLRTGSTVNNLTGILSFGFNFYRVQPTQAPAFTYAPRPLNPPSTGAADLKIASFNVLNYFNGDGNGGGFPTPRGATNATEFARQRTKIIAAIKALNADVVGLLEMENDGDGATSAIADLVRGLNDATAPGTYDYVRDPANGGTGTDEIKVAFIYKPGAVTPLGNARADLSAVHNRPPLAQTFTVTKTGEVLTAVINHFKSKGGTGSGADADQGDGQGAFNFTRVQQAQALATFVNNTVIPATGDSDVILLGDLNAYSEEDPIDVLRAAGFINLFGPESYSYVFDRQTGSLDHALVTASLQSQFTQGGKWHINADEPLFLDYNTEFKTAAQVTNFFQANPFRSSDHDPVLVGFRFNAAPSLGSIGDTVVTAGDLLAFTLTANDPNNNDLSYSIANGSQDGMNLDAGTGKFTWTPSDAQTGSFEVTFRVTDNGNPAKSDQETITITVRKKTAVQFAATAASVGEGSGNYTVELSFTAPLAQEEQVSVSLQNGAGLAYGSDYTVNGQASQPGPLTLTVPAGSTSASLTVNVKEDNADELGEVLTLLLSGTSSGLTVGTPDAFALTITDNDVPAVTFASTGVARAEGSGAYSVVMNADVAPAVDLPVRVTINEGVNVTYGPGRDYVTNPNGLSRTLTVTIPAGQQRA